MKCELATRFIDINLGNGEIREGAIDDNPFRLTFEVSIEKAYDLMIGLQALFNKSKKGQSFMEKVTMNEFKVSLKNDKILLSRGVALSPNEAKKVIKQIQAAIESLESETSRPCQCGSGQDCMNCSQQNSCCG